MKYSTIIAAAAALTGVSAQLANIPQCALGCAISSLGSTGCATTDIKCICQASGFIAALTPCVQSACSAADLEKTIQAATGLCLQAGVTLSLPTATATTAAPTTSATEASVTSVVSTSTEVVATSTYVVSTLTTSASASSSYTASNSTATGGSGNGTVTTGKPTGTSAVPTVSPTGNAAARNSVAIGGIVLAFAAALL